MTQAAVEIDGPWTHRYVPANGARFHVVVADPAAPAVAPPVLLLHGFPQFWWCWRAQLPALAAAGHPVAAMDLRGYGGSDKTPRGYDPMTLAADVAGVIKALGWSPAAVVGHGWGGYVAWTTAHAHPREVRAVASLSAPHPREMLRALWRHRPQALGHVLSMQLPLVPERRLARGRSLTRHLDAWSAPGCSAFGPAERQVYADALRLWPAPHCALEYHRWLFRSRLREDGRAFRRLTADPLNLPALLVLGGVDPALPDPAGDRSARHVIGPWRREVIAGAGHFLPEEAPGQVSELLVDWLAGLGDSGG